MAQHTIRTSKALDLVAKAADVGILARFVKQDGEFFVLQTREENERTYSDVFDSTEWEDVASTLQGMINSELQKARVASEAAAYKATKTSPAIVAPTLPMAPMTEAVNEALIDLVTTLRKQVEEVTNIIEKGAHAGKYVVRHGGVMGLYLKYDKKPAGIAYARVHGDFAEAQQVARLVKNGDNVQGEAVYYLGALQIERVELKKLLNMLQHNNPTHPIFN